MGWYIPDVIYVGAGGSELHKGIDLRIFLAIVIHDLAYVMDTVVIGVHEEEEEGPVLELLPRHPGLFLVTQDSGMVFCFNEKMKGSSWDPPDAVAGGFGTAEFVNSEMKGAEEEGPGGGLMGFNRRSSS
ncbi:hypothetical protein HDV00_009235 [Rhizophlyctis rosea]|nr:hypothetical protein HDV00_009235 [Rhizophlyctis rosea]